jgi:hypothetical protein
VLKIGGCAAKNGLVVHYQCVKKPSHNSATNVMALVERKKGSVTKKDLEQCL